MIEVVVWKVLNWKKSSYGDYDYMRVAMKPTDGSKQVYLNLAKKSGHENWLPVLKEGNVLKVTMHPNGYVNQFQPFQVVEIKEKNKGV